MNLPAFKGTYDVIIIGAGIIGLAHALQQLKRGKRVAVFERSPGIQGASIRNFGHIGITTQSGEAREYADASRELWFELAEQVGFWLSAKGAAVVARSQNEMALIEEFAETRGSTEVVVLGKSHITDLTPVRDERLLGGAQLELDLQVDSRVALPMIAKWLEACGVDFYWGTSVQHVQSGAVLTAEGSFAAEQIFVAVNYNIDQFYPDIAEQAGIERCNLQMLSFRPPWEGLLDYPILTGWSMVRYSVFKQLSGYSRVRSELHMQYPELSGIDLNQMYAQRRDGSLVVGDSHALSDTEIVFQDELTNRLLEKVTKNFFGLEELRVQERWQGVYASAKDDFFVCEARPGVWITAVTTGIGMSCGLGFVQKITEKIEASQQSELRIA